MNNPTAAKPDTSSTTANKESIIHVFPGLQRRKGFFNVSAETYSMVITTRRLIFALTTGDMMKQAIAQAGQDAKQQGKGLVGRLVAQAGWQTVLARRYRNMSPDAIIAESAGNFQLAYAQVKKVAFTHDIGDENSSGADFLNMEIDKEKLKFEIKGPNPADIKNQLRQVFGSIVK